jgi:predicted transcriptional regulator
MNENCEHGLHCTHGEAQSWSGDLTKVTERGMCCHCGSKMIRRGKAGRDPEHGPHVKTESVITWTAWYTKEEWVTRKERIDP